MKFQIDDKVCVIGSGNYPRMVIKAIAEDGSYRCVGTNYRLSGKARFIDRFFKEEELEAWENHAGVIYLRDKSTFR